MLRNCRLKFTRRKLRMRKCYITTEKVRNFLYCYVLWAKTLIVAAFTTDVALCLLLPMRASRDRLSKRCAVCAIYSQPPSSKKIITYSPLQRTNYNAKEKNFPRKGSESRCCVPQAGEVGTRERKKGVVCK